MPTYSIEWGRGDVPEGVWRGLRQVAGDRSQDHWIWMGTSDPETPVKDATWTEAQRTPERWLMMTAYPDHVYRGASPRLQPKVACEWSEETGYKCLNPGHRIVKESHVRPRTTQWRSEADDRAMREYRREDVPGTPPNIVPRPPRVWIQDPLPST